MNIYDASKVLGLCGEITPQIAKSAYRRSCKIYHPDVNPAGDEMMKLINQAYDALKNYSGEIKEQQTNYSELLNDALNAVCSLQGLIIEICGSWVWITGNTRNHKDMLKQAGFKWAPKKKAWYFRPEEFRSRSKGKTSLEDIRQKYGSSRPNQGSYMITGGAQ